MKTFHDGISLVSPDGLGNHPVVAVYFGLPQHPSLGNTVVSTVEEKTFSASVCVMVHHLPGLIEALLHCIKLGLVYHL